MKFLHWMKMKQINGMLRNVYKGLAQNVPPKKNPVKRKESAKFPSKPAKKMRTKNCDQKSGELYDRQVLGSKMKSPLVSNNPQEFRHNCGKCKRSYKYATLLEKHFAQKHFTLLKCKQCPDTSNGFESVEKLKEHARDQHFEQDYFCKLCEDVSPTFVHHELHLREHIRTDPITGLRYCPFCEKELTTKRRDHAYTHLLIHIDPEYYRFQCSYCDQRFYSYNKQREHENVSHTGALSYVCSLCNRGFCTSARRAVHKKNCKGPKV